jgi:hypothetical protein
MSMQCALNADGTAFSEYFEGSVKAVLLKASVVDEAKSVKVRRLFETRALMHVDVKNVEEVEGKERVTFLVYYSEDAAEVENRFTSGWLVNEKDSNGMTPLHYACKMAGVEMKLRNRPTKKARDIKDCLAGFETVHFLLLRGGNFGSATTPGPSATS